MTTPPPLRGITRAPAAVLVLAPDAPVRTALERSLRDEKLEVICVGTMDHALASLAAGGFGCLLVDDAQPSLDLQRLTDALLTHEPGGGGVLLASSDAVGEHGPPGGAFEFLTKPVDLSDLCQAIRGRLRRRDATLESHQINAWLTEEVGTRTADLAAERENLRRLSVGSLEALVNALEAKDPHLRGHSMRVSELAHRLAEAMGLETSLCEAIGSAGRLHDLGKIGVAEAVLRKQGPLTDEEFDHIKTHPVIGAEILAPLTHLGPVLGFVRHHHERWDGRGYPDGLTKESIPIGARIICAVETFDALTTSRPYQHVMSPAQAVVRMRELVGTVLDPQVYDALARVVEATAPSPPGSPR